MTSREDELMRRLRAAFQIEARESVEALAAQLLDLEKAAPQILLSPDAEVRLPGDAVETVYREAHNLKGAARAVNMAAIEALCQPLESVFAVWKKGVTAGETVVGAETLRATLSPLAFDALHSALKAISQVLDAESAGQAVPDVHSIARQLAALSQGQTLPPESAGFERREPTTERRLTEERRNDYEERRHDAEDRRAVERRDEEDRRHVTEGVPTVEQRQGIGDRRHEERRIKSPERRDYAIERRQYDERRHVDDRRGVRVGASSSERRPPLRKAPEIETVRIATSKLDALLLQAEELLTAKQAVRRQSSTARQMLEQVALLENEWAKVLPSLRMAVENDGHKSSVLLDFIEWHRAHLKKIQGTGSALAAQLSGDGRALGGLIDTLLEDTKKLLMLPSAVLLMQFPRTVRDVARERGKEVDFFTDGSEVEVDKRILEALKAPLLHLLRNAIDHGIETRESRRAQGKPECATIEVGVVQSGGEVEFCVRDDGGGLNIEKIKERAVQNGILTPDAALHISDEAAAHLIFASDLSTSDKIDELSGRGLGMAIVRDQVERLGGRVALETVPRQGTVFRLTLPQTLATFRGLLVTASGQTFVFPTADVTQVARVRRETIRAIGTRETVRLNGRTLRLLPLVDALGLPSVAGEDVNWQMVVVLGGERGTAFGVDAILDEQEVLVKRLGWPLTKVRHVTGATVLADGNAAPILNVTELLQAAMQSNARQTVQEKFQSHVSAPVSKLILVVDDSITSRMLLKDILEASGFRVQTAVDGLDALTALRDGQFDLLVSDVDMPRLDGFSLVERVRQEPQLKDLPTVLVTGRDTKEDRERGFDAGASAYVVKSNFDQSNLLEIVRRLI